MTKFSKMKSEYDSLPAGPERQSSGTPPSFEKRHGSRLSVPDAPPLQMSLRLRDGTLQKASLNDLSIGGFACRFFTPQALSRGHRTRVDFKLPLEEPTIISADAVFIGGKKTGAEDGPLLESFRFSETLDTQKKDRIHQFIVKKRLESISKRPRRQNS